MIDKLKELLAAELKAKEKAVAPYNQRIKNLNAAIRNLERFDVEAVNMKAANKPEPLTTPKAK